MCIYKEYLKNDEKAEVQYVKHNESIFYDIEKITVGNKNLTEMVEFHFSVYVTEKYATFAINTENCENYGLGTFLINSMLDILKTYNIRFVAGKLSTADYENGNWERSIPFYLKKLPNSYIVEAYENKSIRYFYNMIIERSKKLKYFYDKESFIKRNLGKKDGYVICPL